MSVPRPQRRVSWGNFHTLEFDKDKRDLELRKGIQHLPISPSSAAMNIPTGTGKSQKGGLRRASSDPLTETGASRGRRASAPSPTSKQAEGLDASRGGGANFLQAVQRQQQQKQMPTPSGLLGLTAIAASSSISPKELLQGSPQAHTDVVRRRQSAPLPRSPSPITRPPGPLPSSLGGSPETSEAQRRGSLSQTVQSKAKQKEVPTDPSSSSSSLPPPVFYPSAEELQPTSLEAFPLSDYLGKRDRDQGEPSGTGEENSLLDPSVSLSFNEKAPAYQEKTKLPGPSRLNNERQFLASVLLSANPLRFPSCLLPAAESEDSGVVDPPGCDFELGGEGASSASASGTACVSQSWMLPSLPSEDQEKEKERLQIKAEEEKEEIDAGRYLDSWQSSSDIFGLAAWRDHLMLNVPSWVSLSPSPCQRRGDGSNRNRTNKSSQRQKEHLQKKVAVDTQKKKKDSPKPKGPPPKTSLSRLLNPLAYINRPPRLTFRPPPAPPATRVPPPSTPPNRVTNPNPILHFSSIEEEAPTFGEPSVSSSAVPQTRHTPGRFCAAIRAPILEEPSAPVLRPQRVPLREGDRGLPLPVDERTAVISGDDIVHGGPGVKGGIFSNTKEEEEEEECLGLGILCQDSLAAWRRRAEPRPERAHQRSLASLPDAASSSCTDGSTGPRTSLQPDLSLPRLGGPRPLVCLPPEQRHPNNHSGSASGSVSQDEEERRRSGARELHSCSVTDVTAEGAITDPVVRCESREGAGEWRVRKSKDKGGKGIVREKEVNREGKKGKEERGDPKKTKEQSGKMEMEQERREGETSHRRPLRFASSSS
uniref:Uncharacterized protein n=1 Tax=Chromera velia CCMP2878 TaxID=1169474 RepID=A0A0G4HNH1_9ALVE|eukprot:Cvel_29423.t1-p1 / transcript=Cvel_29423.t1 / gene=Cvel_29423 / organism=Chromera_velia_CCMP2878 / gene_product=hypothetical protein / transcript_product=hypothetical protein / location=Cvel_scaffold4018:8453-10906(-) / protein_length=818 / sequence_SO=supercontig / SO=protein_coding / is_pseudo=false